MGVHTPTQRAITITTITTSLSSLWKSDLCGKSHHVPLQTSQLSCFSGSSEKSPTWLSYQRCLKRGSYRLIISTAATGLLRQSTNYIHQTPAGFSNYEHLACHLSHAYREACLFFAAWFVYCVPWNNRHRSQDEVCAEKRFPSWPGEDESYCPPRVERFVYGVVRRVTPNRRFNLQQVHQRVKKKNVRLSCMYACLAM